MSLMATAKRTLLILSIISLLSSCAPAIPPSNPRLDVNMKRLPGTVLLLSNLQDGYRFYRTIEVKAGSGRDSVSGTKTRIINVGKSSHHLFVAGLTHLFDKVLTIGQEPAEQDYDYQLIPSIAYNAHPGKHWSCEARVRYGALLRHRDGRTMEFDSGWTEVKQNEPNALFYDVDTYCYWAAFIRAEEQAFHTLAQKISTSQFAASSIDNQTPAPAMTSTEWATEHADAKIKLARLIDSLRKDVSAKRPRKKTIIGPLTSTDEQQNPNFTTYVLGQIYERMGGTIEPVHLYWTLNQYAILFQDLTNMSSARTISKDTGADSILFGTFTTEEPWIKVQLSLYDVSSGIKIASKETRLYKDVTIRALLERGNKTATCELCDNPLRFNKFNP
jgi:hypothetical protein